MDEVTEDLTQEKWFVLNMIPAGANITENPKHECFDTEKDAIAYAKECARGEDSADNCTYHIMRTIAVVSAVRRISVKMTKPKARR